MAEEQQKKTKPKAPTAQKRMLQDEKKNAQNKVFKSRLRTAIRNFTDHLKENKQEDLTQDLKSLHALIDKAVKRNVYKLNKARREKSKYAKKLQEAAV